jgi:hypothetical protein
MEPVDSLGGIDFMDTNYDVGTFGPKEALALNDYQGICVKEMLEQYINTLKELN